MARILVIDDDAMIRQLLRRALETLGHTTLEAENGRVGLERFHPTLVDLVITDILMPQMNGLEFIQALMHSFPSVKVIALTGNDPRYLEQAMALGAQRVFRKPFSLAEILDAVRTLIPCPN